jgi:thioesterase domain-containing protein
MARQLSQQGEETGLLAMFDTRPPGIEQDGLPMLAHFAADISRLAGQEPLTLRDHYLLLDPREQWDLVQEALVEHGIFSRETVHTEMPRLFNIFSQNWSSMERYEPQISEQRIVAFYSSDTNEPERIARKWAELALGGVETHRLKADHYVMLRQPHVSAIVAELKRHIGALEELSEIL